MSDLGLLNFGNEELDYDENEIENMPEDDNDVTKKTNSESDGEISDDGEIKSDTEDGEITGSDSDGEVIEPEDAPKVDLFPDVKPKQPPPPQPELTPQQQARSTIPCRYYRQGYCQFGQKCHFMHDRPGLQIINPVKEPEPDKGSYELFPSDNKSRRPPPDHIHKNSQSRPQIHYPPTREDNSWAQGIGKANEFRRRKPGELDPNDARRKISDKKSSRSPDRNLKKRPKLERVRDSHRDSIDSDKRKSRSRSKTKDRWDLHRDYEHSMKRKGKRKRSETSSSSSSSSSESDSTSESSGRATPKGYRSNRNGAKTSSEDEEYKREKRLQDKAKKYSSKKSSHSSRSSRSSSLRSRPKTQSSKSKKRRSRDSSSSSSSSSSDSDSSTASSSSEKKLQKRLKEVERVLKEKKKTEKRKSRKK